MKFGGYTYQRTNFVVTSFQEDDLPQFSQIDDIILLADCTLLQVIDFCTDGILQHYHSFSITSSRSKRTIYLKDLIDPRPLNSHSINNINSSIVTIRSSVIPACSC